MPSAHPHPQQLFRPGPSHLQDDKNLRVVEVGQPLCSEALGQLALDDDVLHLVAKQFMVDIA